MTSLAAVHAVLPPHRYPQDKITEAFGEHVLGATMHTAWITAVVFSVLNAWLLRVRITAENAALTLAASAPAAVTSPRTSAPS